MTEAEAKAMVDEAWDGLYERCGIARVQALPPRKVRFRRLRLWWIRLHLWWIQRRMARLSRRMWHAPKGTP